MSLCSLRLQADSAPVNVLHQCGLFRTPQGLGACWAQQNVEGDAWSIVQGVFSCVGRTAFHVITHDLHDSLHSARVMVLPDTGSSYLLEGAGSGRWSLWHPFHQNMRNLYNDLSRHPAHTMTTMQFGPDGISRDYLLDRWKKI